MSFLCGHQNFELNFLAKNMVHLLAMPFVNTLSTHWFCDQKGRGLRRGLSWKGAVLQSCSRRHWTGLLPEKSGRKEVGGGGDWGHIPAPTINV